MPEQHHSSSFKDFAAWLFLCRGSVVRWPLLRFTGQSIAALFSPRDSSKAPVPKLVLRVGVAGHIDLPEGPDLAPLIDEGLRSMQHALTAVREDYRAAFKTAETPAVECRLICQLAAGADQLVADRAERLGYVLQCPLPMDLESYAEDLRRNPGVDPDPVGGLYRLIAKATVLQLDGKIGSPERSDGPEKNDSNAQRLTELTYENGALTMLEHSDVLLAIVRSNAERLPGGTRWLVDEAERRGMAVIELVPDKPSESRLWQGPASNRCDTTLAGMDWVSTLVRNLVLPQQGMTAFPPTGWFEERFRTRVQANESEWPPNWAGAGSAARTEPQVQTWMEGIKHDYFRFWKWAEHRANTYRNLYQGAYVAVAGLALTAVVGALLGALDEDLSVPGKGLELVVIILLLGLWRRAFSGRWRQRWLGYRLLEQQINNAAMLELVGRTIPTQSSPSLHEFEKEGAWIQWYLRAVLRQANLPAGKLEQRNLIEAGNLILSGKIGRQIDYYRAAIDHNHHANHRLEAIALLSLKLTLATAVAYLAVHYFHCSLHLSDVPFRMAAMATGIVGPALVAALAAIRAQGEFVQLEARYRGMTVHLEDLRDRFAATLERAAKEPMPLLSWQLARYSQEAAGWMLDEVSQWRSLLHTNEIERG